MSTPDPVAARIADIKAQGYDLSPVPSLVAAVEAVLKIHRTDERALLCAGCADVWPCQDYRAITAALLGKDDTDPAAEIEPPRTETDCACGDDCPCDANGPDGLCACCRNGDHDGRCGPLGGSTNPTPDCGGPRKPPGATEVWWCDTHREFHGTKEATDG